MLKNIKYLHDKGILVGDLKPDNILVKNKNEVYFIDCGCYQIEDYACPVCHPEYTKRIFKKDEIKKCYEAIADEVKGMRDSYKMDMYFDEIVKKNKELSDFDIIAERVEQL